MRTCTISSSAEKYTHNFIEGFSCDPLCNTQSVATEETESACPEGRDILETRKPQPLGARGDERFSAKLIGSEYGEIIFATRAARPLDRNRVWGNIFFLEFSGVLTF